jgi:phage-related protein
MTIPPRHKPVIWFGRTKEYLSSLAVDVRDQVGQALYEAQQGKRHTSVKPLSGYGDANVLEVVADYAGDAFRAVYTLRWPGRVYVLHVFQKKSKTGSKTPKADMDLIDARLKRLRELIAEDVKQKKRTPP